jgi:hypothetical protein
MKSHVRDKAASSWQIWLSTNPDSDATAIWMERKFDVPDSGFWVSENIFSIPATQSHNRLNGFPGVIVFECTPIQNVKDDIERQDSQLPVTYSRSSLSASAQKIPYS